MTVPGDAAVPAVAVRGLGVRYGDRWALRDTTASADRGTLVAVVGPNGAGKSTLLRAVLGTVTPAAGEVEVCGVRRAARRRLVAYVPQRESVDWGFPVSALEVVLMGRSVRRPWVGRTDRAAALEALDAVGMAPLRDRGIGELSGGQQQRVVIARALAQDTPVLLLDEPLEGVDPATRSLVLEVLLRLRDAGRCLLVATHDVEEAARVADRVWGVSGGIVADVPAPTLLQPETLRAVYGDRLLVLPGGDLAVGDQAR